MVQRILLALIIGGTIGMLTAKIKMTQKPVPTPEQTMVTACTAGGGTMKVQTGTVPTTVNGSTIELPVDVNVCITPKKAQP